VIPSRLRPELSDLALVPVRLEEIPGQERPMATPRPSVTKRQREQVKREKQRIKAEKRAQRKQGGQPEESEFEYQNHDEMVNR